MPITELKPVRGARGAGAVTGAINPPPIIPHVKVGENMGGVSKARRVAA